MIIELVLFIVGTILLSVLTIDWKKKDILHKLKNSAFLCGGIITVVKIIIMFSKFEAILNGSTDSEEFSTLLVLMMNILIKFRPLLYGMLCKLVIQPFEKKNKNNEISKSKEIHHDFSILSVREKEVARLAINGYSNAQIADELFISVETVKRHMSTIFEKLNIKSRKELSTTVEI